MKNESIDIVLVDDHLLLREGIEFLLSKVDSIHIIGQASNGKEFLKLLEITGIPDIVLMDIDMPEMDGVEACTIATKKYPGIKIITLTSFQGQEYYYKMIQAGAKGFVPKDAGIEELTKAINEVKNGGSYFPKDLLRKIIFKFGTNESVEIKIHNKYNLSTREREVLALMCQGLSNEEIGIKLFLSPKTIVSHRASLFSKTGTKNSAQLVLFAIKNGIVKI